jgi:hypothetical protein
MDLQGLSSIAEQRSGSLTRQFSYNGLLQLQAAGEPLATICGVLARAVNWSI